VPVNAPQQQFVSRPVQEIFGYRPGYGFAGFAVNTAIGNYTHTDVDLGFPGGLLGLLDSTRSYNSQNTAGGTLGRGWTGPHSTGLAPPANNAAGPVAFHDEDGRVLTFTPDPAGGYTRPQDLTADLTKNPTAPSPLPTTAA
jgi:Domain of unknown function (DUF6531)